MAVKGFEFLRIQQREDGGWPIDTDLSTWVTTLSIKALGEQLNEVLGERRLMRLREHLLRLQYHHKHPFNGAEPGGWGWTNNPGSVPDADDTPGVILALLSIYNGSIEELNAIEKGCLWLAGVQNRDGGFPTFCRGWGRLPFDRSCADLTGHAMLAMAKTVEILHDRIQPGLEAKISRSISMAMGFLTKQQADDGSWLPLWFGNQLTDDKSNPVYGTARVCAYLGDCLVMDRLDPDIIRHLGKMVLKARDFLLTSRIATGHGAAEKVSMDQLRRQPLQLVHLHQQVTNRLIMPLNGWAGRKFSKLHQ